MQSEKSFTRKYVYNGDNIFAEYDEANNLLAKYTHSPLAPDDILEAEITDSGVQGGLAKSAGKFEYLKDALGTVTDIADPNGNVVQNILEQQQSGLTFLPTVPVLNPFLRGATV